MREKEKPVMGHVEPIHHKEKEPVSQVLLILCRTWLFMAIGALVLYFVVAAIERNKITITTVHSYRVPIEYEHTPESEGE